jgi:hypothetical protein
MSMSAPDRPDGPDRPGRLSRRRVLLGVPAAVVAAKLASPASEARAASSAKPRVLECAADLLKTS